MKKGKKLRKRDILIWIIVIVAALAAVIIAAEMIENIPRNKPSEDSAADDEEKIPPQVVSGDIGIDEDNGVPEGVVPTDQVSAEGEYTGKYNNNIKNILILGIDKQELEESDYYRMGGQSDVIMILSLNLKTKEYFILSVNRDLSVPVENFAYDGSSYGVVDEQIALSYAYGDGGKASGRNVMRSLQWLLTDDINFMGYIAAPIPIVRTLADAVGGVEVTIEDDFTGVDEDLVMGETVVLTGEHAENFVRARMMMKESNTNAMRMDRQIAFMESFMKKAKETMTADQIVDLYSDILDMVKTDMGTSDITKWILNCYDYKFNGFYRLNGTSGPEKHNARCTYREPEIIHDMVQELYYE